MMIVSGEDYEQPDFNYINRALRHNYLILPIATTVVFLIDLQA